MGDFVTSQTTTLADLLPDGEKSTAPGVSYRPGWTSDNVLRASEVNAIANALLDARTAIRGITVNVQNYGAVGDDATDDTAAIQAAATAAASSGSSLFFPPGTYRITPTEGAAFATWTAASNIRIYGDGAIIHDVKTYSTDPLTPIFLFDNCDNVEVTGLEYQGTALSAPATQLGYYGATFVRAINGTTNVAVKAKIQHARYGVQTGDYSDETKGGCSAFRLDLVTYLCGYPIALYRADDVLAVINAQDVHRAAYLAGIRGGSLDVSFKDMRISGVAVLMTDAKTGVGTSRGCSNLAIRVQDTGSTVYPVAPSLAGISLSRVDPGTTFENLDVRVQLVSTDTVAATMTASKILSSAKTAEPSYAFNWEPTITLRNIRVTGVVDKSAQTTDVDPTGLIYLSTVDSGAHRATVSGIVLQNLVLLPSSGNTRACYLMVPGLADQVLLDNVKAPSLNWVLESPATAPIIIRNSQLGGLTRENTIALRMLDSAIASAADNVLSGAESVNSTVGGSGARILCKQVTLSLSGASVSSASFFEAGMLVLGMAGRVTQEITGATGYLVGIATATSRYANRNDLAVGLAWGSLASTETSPRYYGSADNLVVTAKTNPFTAGQVRLMLYYMLIGAPTA